MLAIFSNILFSVQVTLDHLVKSNATDTLKQELARLRRVVIRHQSREKKLPTCVCSYNLIAKTIRL